MKFSLYRPDYLTEISEVRKCRKAISRDKTFVNENLIRFSERETGTAFEIRKRLTPNPPDLRIAYNKLCDSIRARLGDVYRVSGLNEFIDATNGVNEGIDGKGASMISVVSNKVLRELLVARRVGLFLARGEAPTTLNESAKYPQLKVIPVEDIINYRYDEAGELTGLVLKATVPTYNADGFKTGDRLIYEKFILNDGQVTLTQLNSDATEISTKVINYPKIPFHIIEIDEAPVSLALGAHDALLQLSSSDFFFLNKSNYPFYVEQYDLSKELQMRQLRQNEEPEEEKGRPTNEISTGTNTGRRYPLGTDKPGFIAPPTEHLAASEIKQDRMRSQIEDIMSVDSLRVSNKQASSESKKEDKETLIGNVQKLFDLFETAENALALYFHLYYDSSSKYSIVYPRTLDLRSESTRIKAAKEKLELRDFVASVTFKRVLTLEAIRDVLPKANPEELETIAKELRNAPLHISLSKLIDLQKNKAVHLEELLPAIGLDKSLAEKIIKYQDERMKLIQSMQTGNAPNSPGEPNAKPETEETEE